MSSVSTQECTFQDGIIRLIVAHGSLVRKPEGYNHEFALYDRDSLVLIKVLRNETK
ncbi:hypothetical protein [Shewanella sp. 30m-9]